MMRLAVLSLLATIAVAPAARAIPLSAYQVYNMPYFDAYVLNDVADATNTDWYSMRFEMAGGHWTGNSSGSVSLGVMLVAHAGYLIDRAWAAHGTWLYAGIPGWASSTITITFSPGGTYSSYAGIGSYGDNGANDFQQTEMLPGGVAAVTVMIEDSANVGPDGSYATIKSFGINLGIIAGDNPGFTPDFDAPEPASAALLLTGLLGLASLARASGARCSGARLPLA